MRCRERSLKLNPMRARSYQGLNLHAAFWKTSCDVDHEGGVFDREIHEGWTGEIGEMIPLQSARELLPRLRSKDGGNYDDDDEDADGAVKYSSLDVTNGEEKIHVDPVFDFCEISFSSVAHPLVLVHLRVWLGSPASPNRFLSRSSR